MGRKHDIRQIEAIAREYAMDPEERREFGDYIEDCKRAGEKGSGRDGDFTTMSCERRPANSAERADGHQAD